MKIRSLLKLPTFCLLLAFGASIVRAQFNPVQLTPASYTFSIVAPSNTVQAVPNCINATAGSGACIWYCDSTFYEMGMNNPYPFPGWNSGIPVHGTVFTSINNSNITFLMPPDYTTNNDLMIVNDNNAGYGVITSGSLNFVTPSTASTLAILDTGGNGGAVVTYVVTHNDNSTETGTINVLDWFNGGSTAAWGANGNMDAYGDFNNFTDSPLNNNLPYLYADIIPVSSNTPIVSITFNYSSGGGVDNFYAVSGANGGSVYTPIPVSGFNVISTIPALSPLPVNATMDSATNLIPDNGGLGNTWFEQGYDLNNPTFGLPPSGSTFASFSQSNHFFRMGNYQSNNAILIDTNHQSSSITPANPAVYYALAFLAAGDNIGFYGDIMTNFCIIQHQDGVDETNIIPGYNWYDGTFWGAIAYFADGTVNLDNRTLNDFGGGPPYLFETDFLLNDYTSPVTNIIVGFNTAPSANSDTFIMAVSGSTNPIAPVITQEPQPSSQIGFPFQPASISVLATGTQPLTNQWLAERNGVYYPLQDGLDANGSYISGSSTTNLTISNPAPADCTYYKFIAANAGGSVTSSPAAITTPLAPIIDSQTPAASFGVLTNHSHTTMFSIAVDPSSAPVISYQWYSVIDNVTNPIAGATAASYSNVDTNTETIFCIASNFVGATQSTPVTVTIIQPPPLSPYESAIVAGNPVGFWPLNESSGVFAFDYAGTNDGTYIGNFTLGNIGFSTAGTGQNTVAGFDGSTAYVSIAGSGSLNIKGPITVVQLIQPPNGGDNGFTTSLGHSDQSYRLDVGNGQPHWADGGADIVDPNTVNDGNWHQLVGVLDGTTERLYVDGQPVGGTASGPPPGSTDNLLIGAAPDYLGGRDFQGNIADVAIYTNAFTPAQVASLYSSLQVGTSVSVTPRTPEIYAGQNITFTANIGTAPTSLQWFMIDTSNNSNNIPGATGNTFTIDNVPAMYNGYTFGVIAVNAYGTNFASTVLTVQNVAAFLLPGGNLTPLAAEAFVGAPVTYTVKAAGSLPISYQWTLNGTNLSGATGSSFSFPTPLGTNTLQVNVSNSVSTGTGVQSTVTLIGTPLPSVVTFNTNGTGWQLNYTNTVATIANNVLELTDNNYSEASSAFYTYAQYVDSGFTASFTYTAGGNIGADGTVFILQNYPAGPKSLGIGGGGLGYYPITNSVGLELNIYNNNVIGIALGTEGNTLEEGSGAQYGSTGNVQLNSGDPINFTLNYTNGNLAVQLSDPIISATFTTNYYVGSLAPLLGGSELAYVGFSGGDGGGASIQTVSNFVFTSTMPAVMLEQPVTLPDGTFSFTFTNFSGRSFSAWAAQNISLALSNWTLLGSAQEISPGQYQFTDSQATNFAQRFYIISSP